MAATRVRLAPATAIRALCSYAKLGLQRGASDDAVRQAFREAAQIHHPDKVGGDRARFEECKAAADAILDRTEGASDEPPQFDSCGATAPASAAYRSLGDSAPAGTDLVLPKMTRTHAIVEEGWAFAE